VVESRAPCALIFGKSWLQHVEKQLKATPEQNLQMIQDSVSFLANKGLEVLYAAEHFFDGYKSDSGYAQNCLKSAAEAGAVTVVLCDTNGGMLPDDIGRAVADVSAFWKREKLGATLGVHTHNDSGCAVANTLIAVEHGCTHVQGTINGIGERTGNADLCQIIPALALKKHVKLGVSVKDLKRVSEQCYALAGIKPHRNQPYVGTNAFSHKGGIHVDAVSKGASYEHINPELVGNSRQMVLSELSGKASIVNLLKKFKVYPTKDDKRVANMLSEVKAMEGKGYGVNSLEAEQYLLVARHFHKVHPWSLFRVKSWRVSSEQRKGEYSQCEIVGTVNGKQREVVGVVKGGPVHALYTAMQKLIATRHRTIKKVRLVNYKVMIAEDKGAASTVRVYIQFQDNGNSWATAGVSANILEASLEALEKGFRYFLLTTVKD
jgi:2-isopropylmalate synthase